MAPSDGAVRPEPPARLPRARIERRRPRRPPAGGDRGARPRAGSRSTPSPPRYETEPVGEILDQPDFLNAAIEIRTALEPEELLDVCKRIEAERGRELGRRAPRAAAARRRPAAARRARARDRAADAPARGGDQPAFRARAAARARPRADAPRRHAAGRRARRGSSRASASCGARSRSRRAAVATRAARASSGGRIGGVRPG